jgi:hypothetical protein
MSNMTESQRAQFERANYAGSADRIRRGSERGASIFNLLAALVAAALCYGALTLMDGWWQWVVLGAIVVTTVGVMIAISPARRG